MGLHTMDVDRSLRGSRITAPPGGQTSNIFGGGVYAADASGEILRRPLRQTNAKDITAKVGAPLPGSCAEDASPPAAEKPSSYATGNLFCVEGSQVRSGPCRKIMN